jgi:hypothetical protein
MSITTESLKTLIGETYFDLQHHRGTFNVFTRKNGDVCDGRASPHDVAEARRIAGVLRASGIACKLQVVDEWVEVVIPPANKTA